MGRIRSLFAPSLVGRYEIVLYLKAYWDETPQNIPELLHNLIPGQFKLSYHKNGRQLVQQPGALTKSNSVRRIYLKDEKNLFVIQLAFQDKIHRIMRVQQKVCDFPKPC